MTRGTIEEIKVVRRYVSLNKAFREALEQAPPGVMDKTLLGLLEYEIWPLSGAAHAAAQIWAVTAAIACPATPVAAQNRGPFATARAAHSRDAADALPD